MFAHPQSLNATDASMAEGVASERRQRDVGPLVLKCVHQVGTFSQLLRLDAARVAVWRSPTWLSPRPALSPPSAAGMKVATYGANRGGIAKALRDASYEVWCGDPCSRLWGMGHYIALIIAHTPVSEGTRSSATRALRLSALGNGTGTDE